MRIVLTILIGLPYFGFTQTGPGGVGNSSSNIFWLDANSINGYADGDNLDTWIDVSGNGLDFTQPTTTLTPEYRTDVVNGHPVVRFNKTLGRIRRVGLNSFPSTEITQFIVNSNSGESNDALVSYASSTHNNNFLIFGSSNIGIYINSGNYSGISANDGNFHIVNPSWRSSDGDLQLWLDGTTSYSTTHQTGASITPNGCFAIAGEQDAVDGSYDANQAHFGDFSEVFIYNFRLNQAQRIIVNNYLAAKYNIVLGGNDLYDEDNVNNGNYDHEVAGIGQASDGSNHTDAQGKGIVRINNPSNLNNDEYLIWGHNNGILQATELIDVPTGVQARFDRVWRVSEVNSSLTAVDVGNIDIRWDLTGFGSVTASDLRLLIDTDNDGSFTDETIGTGGIIAGATLIGGNSYQFAGISQITNNLRFTLGTINSPQTPLPIELINFNASPLNKKYVQLDWQTASEKNNNYFTIERSQNGIDWENINKVDGAGNSSVLINYSAVDYLPYTGTSYYRLKQTDFDGQFAFSDVKVVRINNLTSVPIEIYPNPTDYQITITGNRLELEKINVYDILGKDITKSVAITKKNNQKILLDLSELSTGVYYIKTKTVTNKVYKK